jgi:hypothetical protein
MIRKKVPGAGTMFDFADKDQAKEIIRSRIKDSMADEAKKCFDFATGLFQDMLND